MKANEVVFRNINLGNLPKTKNGKGISWKDSVGKFIDGTYDTTDFIFLITEYRRINNHAILTIDFLGEKLEISSECLQRCTLRDVLHNYVIREFEWKYNIGDEIIDNKRDLVIIDRKRFAKGKNKYPLNFYKIKCNKCGFNSGSHYFKTKLIEEYWVDEYQLLKGCGCPCCCPTNKIIVVGINDIPTTDPWMIPYFQGGYDEAKLYTCKNGRRIYPKCPDCGRVRTTSIEIKTIHRNRSIGCICSDGKSYPEKFMTNVLDQLNIKFKYQKSFNWSKDKIYDFYIQNINSIIEVHGEGHYEESFSRIVGGKSLEETQINDAFKEKLAIENGVDKYIIIDARRSDWKWIMKSILNSGINSLYDLSNLDWLKAHEYATKNLVKESCNLWNKGKSAKEISKILGLHVSSVGRYLKSGKELNWCDYDEYISYQRGMRTIQSEIICINNSKVYLSTYHASETILKEEDFYISHQNMGIAIKQKRPIKDYMFKNVRDLTEEDKVKYNVEYQIQQRLKERQELIN